jgi:hypothetical protein
VPRHPELDLASEPRGEALRDAVVSFDDVEALIARA